MYFLKTEISKELKLDGMAFEIGSEAGVLVEDGPYEARRKEMAFKDKLEATELEGIIQVKSVAFPESAKTEAAAPSASAATYAEIVAQANKAMKENIALLSMINKLKKMA